MVIRDWTFLPGSAHGSRHRPPPTPTRNGQAPCATATPPPIPIGGGTRTVHCAVDAARDPLALQVGSCINKQITINVIRNSELALLPPFYLTFKAGLQRKYKVRELTQLSNAVSTTCFRDRGDECDPPPAHVRPAGPERAGLPGRRRAPTRPRRKRK